MKAPLPDGEADRLNALQQYDILDTPAEMAFDDLTRLAAHICGTPTALISLVDTNRQWFKSKVGFEASETHRDVALCAHAILAPELFIVSDLSQDHRFFDHPLVVAAPNIRFYAGAPLIVPSGHAIGTLCTIDYKPHELSMEQQEALQILARQVVSQLELRRNLVNLIRADADRKQTEEALLRAKVAEAAKEELSKALAKEKELSELKSRFVTMASHEFRTPLATILSSTELLEDYVHKWSEEKKLHHFQRITSSVKHMTNLLNDVLLIGKAEAGKLEFKPIPLELVQFCRHLVEEIQLACETHTIVFRTQEECTNVCLDEKLLRNILSNLLINAIKYSPQDSTVYFELSCELEKAVFRIQDQGIGIPVADQAHLFKSFHRASNVGTISGTGLGLAITKNAVDLHGGQILVKSEVGSGTTFEVILPLSNNISLNSSQNSVVRSQNTISERRPATD